jgi:hypothetical protein
VYSQHRLEISNIRFKLKFCRNIRKVHCQFLNFRVQIEKPLKLQESKVNFFLNYISLVKDPKQNLNLVLVLVSIPDLVLVEREGGKGFK